MKKILFPALVTLLTLASPVAFAQSGPWYVLHNMNTQDCFAAHRVSVGNEEIVGGPYESQLAALSAIGRNATCSVENGANYD